MYQVFTQYISQGMSFKPHVIESTRSKEDIEVYLKSLSEISTVRRVEIKYNDKRHSAVVIVTEV